MNNAVRSPMPTMPPPMPPGGPIPQAEPSMRERIARYKVLARRALGYWKVASLILVVGCAIALAVAMNVKRQYRSECVILVKPGIVLSTNGEDSPEVRNAKLAARLKDALTLRNKLESAIKKFHLYPKTVDGKGMLDAVDEMRPHVGFRARDSGTFVVSFDSTEEPGRSTQDLVRDVTQYLAEQLIEEYASGNLGDLKMRADFLAKEQSKAEADLEKSTRALTVFLSQHPEFAMEAKQQAAASPFGFAPNPAAGIPLLPSQKDKGAPAPKAPPIDPALASLYASDAQLGALYRQRARLEAEMKSTAPPTPAPAPTTSASVQALQDQINAAQADVEAAAKRAAETQADVMAKQSSLAPEHPDMKAAIAAADVAARQLYQSKVKLASLQAQLRAAQRPSQPSDNPYDAVNPELQQKLKDINSQIATREAELKRGAPPAPAPAAAATASGSAAAPAPPPEVPINPLVALETEWQRLLRTLSDARITNEGLKKQYGDAQMQVKAAEAAAHDLMSVIEPAYRPTHPSKGGRTPAALAGFGVAFVIAMLYMAARVAFNDTIIDAADIESLQLIPVLGVVPKIHVTQAKDGAAAAQKPQGSATSAV